MRSAKSCGVDAGNFLCAGTRPDMRDARQHVTSIETKEERFFGAD
jgi:hypothetical protein